MADPTFHYPAPGQPVDELAVAEIKSAILAKLRLAIGKDAAMATRHDWYHATALALRDRIVHRWLTAEKESYDAGRKRVYYLSLEFLIGRLFTDALNNMGLMKVFETALGDIGPGLSELRQSEPDAALGNGGLGRLAACFMESMATLDDRLRSWPSEARCRLMRSCSEAETKKYSWRKRSSRPAGLSSFG